MRVLFSSTSGHGHVVPMLQLASAVQARGHDVVWATADQATPLVTGAGIAAVGAGAHGADEAALRAAVRDRAGSLDGWERSAWVFPRMFGAALAPPMARDLLALARDWRPDLLVHDQAERAAPLVAAVLDLPSITHAFGTAVPVSTLEATRAHLTGMWREHGLDAPPYAGCFRAGYLDICPPSLQTMSTDHLTDVQALRPVTRSRLTATGPHPLVYVTLGTVQNQPRLLREIVSGVAALPVAVLVAVGPGLDPAALGEQPAHVQGESWVDQTEVLARCSAVVSHAGSGTFLGALAHGLPQLCLPQAADQFRNTDAGLRAGAVLSLGPGEVSAHAVHAAVERLLAEPGLRAAAGRLAAEIEGMPSPDEVVEVLESRFAQRPRTG
jgi:UDP:flavonoid glycosyltransferase YjiC (YdhE family)